MIKTYLINLERSPERLVFMQAQFERLSLDVERIDAVDGSQIDLAPHAGSGLTPGEIGCFLSHRAAWERFVASGETHALVLEDDVRLSAALRTLLDHAGWIPPLAEIVKLDSSERRVGVTRSNTPAPGGHSLHGLLTAHTGAAGYILSRAAALSLLERSAALNEPVDLLLFGAEAAGIRERTVLQLVPAAVVQERRLTTNLPAGLHSLLIPDRRGTRPSGLRRVRRNLVDGLRKAGRLALEQYKAGTQNIRYLRVPFRADA